jgi:NAD+ synthase (glutamine-hydrolysing)
MLLSRAEQVLKELAGTTLNKSTLLAVGLPLLCQNRLYNTVAVCAEGKVQGFAVKKYLSNHRNNFEGRYFSSADTLNDNFVMFDGEMIPLASDIVFAICLTEIFRVETGRPKQRSALHRAILKFRPND